MIKRVMKSTSEVGAGAQPPPKPSDSLKSCLPPAEVAVATETSYDFMRIERAAAAILHAEHPDASGWSGKPPETREHYRKLARAALLAVPQEGPCGCMNYCGDDGDIDGPGVCRGLPR